jgi:hypothetical protein
VNDPRHNDTRSGAVTVAVPVSTLKSGTATTATRVCGTCTACCDGWFAGTIRGHEMKAGLPCHFRGKGCCTIYDERPENPCRTFVCGWLMPNSPLPDAYRPDRLGVLVVPTTWRGALAFILVHAGRDPDEALLGWMRDYARKRRVPFFYEQGGQRFGFGPPEFQCEMAERAAKGERLW